jgi:hypothetical protein
MTWESPRLGLLASSDQGSAGLVTRLLDIAVGALPSMAADGEFTFTVNGTRRPDGTWRLTPAGTSVRYAAITALGLLRLPEQGQQSVLGGESAHDLITRLAKRLDGVTDVGDAALICWAAAEAGHEELPQALRRLTALLARQWPAHVVQTAWVLSALVAARPLLEVEMLLADARERLLAARPGRLYPHRVDRPSAAGAWLRAHVGSFAAQVYPVQAFARLHRSADDQPALAVANDVADQLCARQGASGQWWWHYDSRTGGVVEGYPVYSVHQHAMGPMALLDLAEAGGHDHRQAISHGLAWLARPPETAESLISDDPPITWRKVARNDPRKMARGLRAASTRVLPQLRLGALDRLYPPGVVDHECRPYELGWLLMAWLS